VALTLAGELGGAARTTAVTLAGLADALVLALVVAVVIASGAIRRARSALPVVGRGGPEARIFRLAVVCAVLAAAGFVIATALAASGVAVDLLTDAMRHLFTVGVLTAIVVAMGFRLIVVFERRALPWPGSRAVAFWALLGAVVFRTAEIAVGRAWPGLAPVVVVSGVLVWVAQAAVLANLLGVGRGRLDQPAG